MPIKIKNMVGTLVLRYYWDMPKSVKLELTSAFPALCSYWRLPSYWRSGEEKYHPALLAVSASDAQPPTLLSGLIWHSSSGRLVQLATSNSQYLSRYHCWRIFRGKKLTKCRPSVLLPNAQLFVYRYGCVEDGALTTLPSPSPRLSALKQHGLMRLYQL